MLTGSWGLCPWFEEDGEEIIHPDSREAWKSLRPYGRLFLCVGEEQDWIKLRYSELIYKIKPELFRNVPAPEYSFGEKVQLVKKPDTSGYICDIEWHHKYEKEIYHIEVNGKKKSSRYFAEELIGKEGKGN